MDASDYTHRGTNVKASKKEMNDTFFERNNTLFLTSHTFLPLFVSKQIAQGSKIIAVEVFL
ncbi:MAG: hypothetical protein IIT90_05410, partial [Clostridiales bacterium]|nr:hypothetical protein [Clostridiales bacterium]